MILADTSAWVEFDRATGSAVDLKLRDMIRDGAPLVVTEPVLMEVLAGATDDASQGQLRRMLTSFGWVNVDPIADFEGAATLYRKCRQHGVTPRGLVDCMIASIALRTGAELLVEDQHFTRMAEIVPLRILT